MAPRTHPGSAELGTAIRERRSTLGLSIQEAAAKAGTTAKTWGSYEAGASIRGDKVRTLCRALGWRDLPASGAESDDADEHWLKEVGPGHRAWSAALEHQFGRAGAATFAVGSDILLDHANEDLAELRRRPRGTHLGQLDASWLIDTLPPQFVPRYDYDFVYALVSTVSSLQRRFVAGTLVAHSVIEEIALYLIFGEAEVLADMHPGFFDKDDDWRDWVGDIFDDLDVEFLLFYPEQLLTPDTAYHFDHWLVDQFYMGESVPVSGERDEDE